MNYAFLDLAQEFQLEIVSNFLGQTNSSASFINTAVSGSFHGDERKCLELINQIKSECPEVIHKTLQDFLYPETYSNFIEVPWVISEEDILAYKHIESMSMRLMDRSALVPISAFSRRRLYLLLVNYFSYLIENKSIEGVIVFDTPHSFFSHVFYELCKVKGLKILKLEYHFLTEFSVILNQDSWPITPNEYGKEKSVKDFKSMLPKELVDSIFKNSEVLKDYKSKETKAIVKQNSFSTFKLYYRYFDKVIKNLVMGVFPFFFKKEILHFASLNSIKNRLKYRFILNKQLFKLIRLNIYYNKIANKSLSLNEKYIFVGLHMQPEKTSQPMGGEYDNQLMMIKILSDSVPEGWKVYVKEHPNQFNVRKVPNRHYRDKLFYECVEKLRNTELVPLEIDSLDLIQNAKLVATLTGTLGWEAITKNIPVLVFGNTYYMGCRASRKVNSTDSCKRAIDELIRYTNKQFELDIYRYLAYYYENRWLIHASNWQSSTKINSLSYKDQIENIVNRLVYFHNNKID